MNQGDFFMKKIIIAAALAIVIASPVANANVTIYGKVHLSIDYTQNNDQPSYDGLWSVYSRSSRIGFKGTEDLGNGLSLIWKAETGYDFADGGAWSDSGRNAYIGLTGSWGTFLYGNHDTPYKMAYYSTGIDMMDATIIDMNAIGAFEENRFPNTIAYISPNWNGMTFAASIRPGEGANGTKFSIVNAYSLAFMYSNNGLNLAVAYEDEDDLSYKGSGDDNDRLMVGAGYTMNNLSIAVAYADDNEQRQRSFGYSVGYTFGNNKLVANWGRDDNESGPQEDSWGIGMTHNLSKHTSAYAAYATSDDGTNNESDPGQINSEMEATSGFSVGMIHNF